MSANADFIPRLARCACLINIGELASDLRTHGGKNGKRIRNDDNKKYDRFEQTEWRQIVVAFIIFFSLGHDTFN